MTMDGMNKLQEEPSSHRFYRKVLGWDYFRLLKESSKNRKSVEAAKASGLREVKNTYTDVDDYLATFEPLLFEEVKSQIVKQHEEEEVTDWQMGMIMESNEAEGFHFLVVAYAAEQGERIFQNSLLLLSQEKFQEGGKRLPSAYAFAVVEHCKTSSIRLRMFLKGEIKKTNSDEIEASPRLSKMHSLIANAQQRVYILKLCSLSTIVREYNGLRSINSLPFKDLILTAAKCYSVSEKSSWKISKTLMGSIVDNHNVSQVAAIHAGLSREPFVLIQGPPGTGKTQTILGLLSAILHATPAILHSKAAERRVKRGPDLQIQDKYYHWVKASPWLTNSNPRDEIMPIDGDDGYFPTTGSDLKPEVVTSSRKYRVRVLVCAPSNSALDEIVLRLLNTGIRDENDRAYVPKIVRIGLDAHHSVKAVSMDYLVKQKVGGRDKDSIHTSIIDEAAIVFSTLGFSGSIPFSKLSSGFDVVIIDEAAQAVELSTLVPLACGCKQVFMVGDPEQLPATVISPIADQFGYGMSLFKRLKTAGFHVHMLKTQYRMHPEIRSFPSKEFYSDELEDGPGVDEQTQRNWHDYRCFGPFCFFDIDDGKESQPSGSGSWVNVDEVDFVVLLHRKLVTRFPDLKSSSQLAIISPYNQQVKLFVERFGETFGSESMNVVDVKTIDGFQGREKDVAIFSCVRASQNRGIGFVSNYRRMNVAITRARSSILVVGNASTLKRGDGHWKKLIEYAESKNSLFKVTKPYDSFFSDENLKNMEIKRLAPQEVEQTDAPFFSNLIGADQEQPAENENDIDEVDGDMDDGGFDNDD